MLLEKIVENSPWLSLISHAISLGFRVGKIGFELAGNFETAAQLGIIAVACGKLGTYLAFFDASMMLGLYGIGSEKFFGGSASWQSTPRLAAYLLSAANSYLAFKDS